MNPSFPHIVRQKQSGLSVAINALCFLSVLALPISAQILHQALDTFGIVEGSIKPFYAETKLGTVSVTTEKVRSGRAAFKHQVEVVPYGSDTRRAELDNKKFGAYHPDSVYWYGFSLYLPSSQFPATMTQLLGQLRFSNIPWNGYTVPNCMMWKDCGVQDPSSTKYFYGGSGHELCIVNGRLIFYLRYQEPGCASCEALDEKQFDLGPAPTDVWVDFIYQAKWSAYAAGFFKIWMRNGNGAYVQVTDYHGPTWVEYNAAGSDSRINGLYGGRVCAPDVTVGLYWNSDNKARYCYSDNIVFYMEQRGIDGLSLIKFSQQSTSTLIRNNPAVDFNRTTIAGSSKDGYVLYDYTGRVRPLISEKRKSIGFRPGVYLKQSTKGNLTESKKVIFCGNRSRPFVQKRVG